MRRINFHEDEDERDIPRARRSGAVQRTSTPVTWPAHVKVQVIPGMERTAGVPANVYVDPASVAMVPISEWGQS